MVRARNGLVQALLLPSIFLFAFTGQKRGRTCFNTWVVIFLHKLQTFNKKQEVFPFHTMIVIHTMSHIIPWSVTQSRQFAWSPCFLANDRASLVCDVTVPVYSVTTQSHLWGRGAAREHYVTAWYLSYDKQTTKELNEGGGLRGEHVDIPRSV